MGKEYKKVVIKSSDTIKSISENPRGGAGIVINNRYLDSAELDNNLTGLYLNELEVGSEIGYHEHFGEEEIYYIVDGNGIITDNDKKIEIKAGDVIYTKSGEGHGMINTGDKPLKFLAFIVKK